jgi:hypothetical protein
MTYTRQDVLAHYNAQRKTNFTLVQLGTMLLTETLRSELRQMLRDDAKAAEDAQVAVI